MAGATDSFSAASGPPDEESLLHATCVSANGRAVLIRGASGSGKSSLALQMMAYGAQLVADDQTIVRRQQDQVYVSAPDTTGGLIEARGVGILRADSVQNVPLHLVVDLDETEELRLPHPREVQVLGKTLPLIFVVEAPYFAAAVLQFLRYGRNA